MLQSLLFLTHEYDQSVEKFLCKVKNECSHNLDIYIFTFEPQLFKNTEWKVIPLSKNDLKNKNLDNNILDSDMDAARVFLPSILKKNCIAEYKYYWLMEYDVLYRGNWCDIFEIQDDADLLTLHIHKYDEIGQEKWIWWKNFSHTLNETVQPIRMFSPLYRISAKGLGALEKCSEWSGHYESVIPSALSHYGCTLSEIGGTSINTPSSRYGKFYTSFPENLECWCGSFRWIPHIFYFKKNTLYHPCKGLFQKVESIKYIPSVIIKIIYLHTFYKKNDGKWIKKPINLLQKIYNFIYIVCKKIIAEIGR